MRIIIGLATVCVFITFPAFADDEFGARFGSNSTVGFEDAQTDPEKALSEIAPAAGEEKEAATTENQAENTEEDAQVEADGQTEVE